MTKHYNWIPGAGGKEPKFRGYDGLHYQMMWNQMPPSSGECEHAYYCFEQDLFLSNEDCEGRIYPPM